MSIINFKEIPPANVSGGEQDTFELFARELLHCLGLKISDGPDRGADGGRDIIAIEKRQGSMGETDFRWLVSCKHKAHSGASVTLDDEQSISDRLEAHKCMGFIGFYSTITSSGLGAKLKLICENKNYEYKLLDGAYIERYLLENEHGISLMKRFFPKCYSKLENKLPSNVFNKYEPLCCDACGKDLLDKNIVDKYDGVVVFVEDYKSYQENGKRKYERIYYACKGKCDSLLEKKAYAQGYSTSWNDISDIIIPTNYMKFIMGILNGLHRGRDEYSEEAFEKLKEFILDVGQMTLRQQSIKEIKRAVELSTLPDGI